MRLDDPSRWGTGPVGQRNYRNYDPSATALDENRGCIIAELRYVSREFPYGYRFPRDFECRSAQSWVDGCVELTKSCFGLTLNVLLPNERSGYAVQWFVEV